tara:strand:- start:357 stop:1007 length:651 start_codon:yes stop_codon:yes gene_type:complete
MIKNNFNKRFLTSLVLMTAVFLMFNYNSVLLFLLLIFGVFSNIEFFNISKKISKNKFVQFFQNLLFTIFIFIFCLSFFVFANIAYLKITLFIISLGCFASDIGGYIVGKLLKGPKLTSISPKKTISGSLGAIIFSIMTINILFFYFTNAFTVGILIVSVLTSIGCQIGDLFFSLLKRKAKIKDTGNFLPGHGGILDRLDGIFLGIPVGFISLILFN